MSVCIVLTPMVVSSWPVIAAAVMGAAASMGFSVHGPELQAEGKRRRKVRKLSGGEQQRVAVARALVNDPTIIVADEPTAHLDRRLSEELLDILEELSRDGKTIVIATHDPLVYEHRLISRVVAMRDGLLGAEDGS